MDAVFKPLDELFPEPAVQLVEFLGKANRKHKRMEPWREKQLVDFIVILGVCSGEFRNAYGRKSMGTFAWAARSILELSVWIDYCNLSNEHAKRFYHDELRDAYQLTKALESFALVQGQRSTVYKETMDALVLHAQKLGMSDPYDDFKRVSDASAEVGRKDEYAAMNKMLSKFAHPTAYAVSTIIRNDSGDTVLYDCILHDGIRLVRSSYQKIKDVTLSRFPEGISAVAESAVEGRKNDTGRVSDRVF